MSEMEEFEVEVALDTSQFKRALTDAQFRLLVWMALTPKDRLRLSILSDAARTMTRFQKSIDEIEGP